MKLPNFENWSNGELSKIGHHFSTGKKLSDVLIYLSINPKYSIPLLGRFTLIIHQNYISRTLVERQLYTDCFAYSAQMNVPYVESIHFFLNVSRFR